MVKKHKKSNDSNTDNEKKTDELTDLEDKILNEEQADDNNHKNDDSNENSEENIVDVNLLKEQLQKKEEELNTYIDVAQRVKAEFDNYKRRALKEKEQLYADISGDIIAKFLPIIDNLERAVNTASESANTNGFIDGIKMTINQFKDVLVKEGVEEIEALGKDFDPSYHNAVMHIEDESLGQNVVIEEFQKGYKIKDKVLRYSMVKVAN